MKVRVQIDCPGLKLVDEVVETESTTKTLCETLNRPGVAEHLRDLRGKDIWARVTVMSSEEVAA